MPRQSLALSRAQPEAAPPEQEPWQAAILQLPVVRACWAPPRTMLAHQRLRLAFLLQVRNWERATSESLQVWLDCQRPVIQAQRRPIP